MTGVGEEGAAVGKHTYEAAQQAKYREGVHLPFHAVLLVIEPPSAAKLYLPWGGTLLEVTQHGGNHFVGRRVEGVEDGLGQQVLHVQTVQELGHADGCVPLADAVETCIGTQLEHHACVVVAQGSVVELLCPARTGIHAGKVEHQGTLELALLKVGWGTSCQDLVEDRVYLRVKEILGIELADTVVGEAAALSLEVVVALLKGINEVAVRMDVLTGGFAQLFYILTVGLGILHSHGFVRTPGGQHLYLETALACGDVVFQRIDGVISGAYAFHMVVSHETAGREFGLL